MNRQTREAMARMFIAPVRLQWVAVAGLAISALSSAMSFSGAKKAEKANKQAAEREAMINIMQAELQKENIHASQEEARVKSANEKHSTTVAFMQQRASVVAGAGEAGVAGGSITRTIVDKTHQEQDIRGASMYALDVFNRQAMRDLKGADLGLAAASQPYKGTSTSSLAIASGLNFASDLLTVGKSEGWKGFT